MNDDINDKGPNSGATSKPPAPVPTAGSMSETEFLEHEATTAREAMSQTLGNMRKSAKDLVDLPGWTRRYPWTTVGVAAAAGFLAVATLLPRRRRLRDEEDPALLERILTDEQIAARLRELAAEDEGRASRAGAVHSTVDILVRTFGPMVQSAVMSALAAKAAAAEVDDQQQRTSENGHPGSHGAS